MKARRSIIIALVVSLFLLGATAAYADPARSAGYPAAIDISVGVPDVGTFSGIVLMKYQANSFTFDEADLSAEQLGALVQMLLGSALGASVDVNGYIYTPSVLAYYGLNSADELADALAWSYWNWWNLYIFVDISKVPAVAGSGLGPNARVNIWLGDAAYVLGSLADMTGLMPGADEATMAAALAQIGVTGSYLYLTSLEVPDVYWQLLGGLTALKK